MRKPEFMKQESKKQELAEKKSGKDNSKEERAEKAVMSPSMAAKKAVSGKDMGKPNIPGKTGFQNVANKAAKEYGSADAGKKVAGAMFQKMRKSGKL
mgnify:CR=1 FL=1